VAAGSSNHKSLSQWPRSRKPESREHRRFMDDLAKSLMEMPLDPPNVNPPANVELLVDVGLSAAGVEPQSIVEPQSKPRETDKFAHDCSHIDLTYLPTISIGNTSKHVDQHLSR